MMKKLITGFLSVLSITLIGVMLSACYGCYTLDGAKDYSGIDCNFFNYSDKATLEHPTHGEFAQLSKDKLKVLGEKDDVMGGITLVYGDFEKYVHTDGKIFVLCEGVYHVFDLDDYHYPTTEEDGLDLENGGVSYVRLHEFVNNNFYHTYTPDEFEEAYPNQERYRWINCKTIE